MSPRLALSAALLLALAPMQCTKKYDPSQAREETAGDGLAALAEDFKAKGNQEAYLATLRFLVTRYPGSRRAEHARAELEKSGASPAASGQP
jgi:hypothetical protein